jgi:TatD DNase family protein
MLSQLESEGTGVRGIMHCFSGNRDDLARALALDFDISFAGPLTYPKNDELRACCTATPIDRIHIETDCPFLPPQFKRGKRNEPAFMTSLLEKVAECVGKSVKEMNEQTTRNTRRLFRI